MLQEFLEIEELKSIHEEKLRLMEREMALSTPLLTELEYIPMLYKWYCELSGCCEESGGRKPQGRIHPSKKRSF